MVIGEIVIRNAIFGIMCIVALTMNSGIVSCGMFMFNFQTSYDIMMSKSSRELFMIMESMPVNTGGPTHFLWGVPHI